MQAGKTILFSTVLAAGATFALGAKDADAAETYTVESGDTLSKISQDIAGDASLVETIAKDNQISDVDKIYVGQKLTINTVSKKAVSVKEAPKEAPKETPAPVAAPVQEAPAPVQEEVQPAPVAAAPASSSAKEWIAQRESNGSYDAQNGRYIGRYQLDASYLNGDYSAENQERVADQYVGSRYGSWEGAQAFWMVNGWY